MPKAAVSHKSVDVVQISQGGEVRVAEYQGPSVQAQWTCDRQKREIRGANESHRERRLRSSMALARGKSILRHALHRPYSQGQDNHEMQT